MNRFIASYKYIPAFAFRFNRSIFLRRALNRAPECRRVIYCLMLLFPFCVNTVGPEFQFSLVGLMSLIDITEIPGLRRHSFITRMHLYKFKYQNSSYLLL